MNIDNLIFTSATLKADIKQKQEQLKKLNEKIIQQIDFEGKKTGYIYGGGYEAKVQLKDKIEYDQGKILEIKKHFQFFHEVFKTEYKPISKAVKAFAKKNKEFETAINWCRTITPATPYIVFTPTEDEEGV